MGTVLVAHHELLDQQVAIKVLSPEFARSTAARERFFREARAAARLKSEHVGRVMDVGVDVDRPYIVMELLNGCDLEQLLELEGPLQPVDVADYVLQALDAMAQAHAVGIIHRDLKPANLFLALRPDGTSIIKVLDFGISKEEGGSKRLTGTQALGSPEYMSPEQVRSAASVDTRTDIWSLGVGMYELLTGTLPFAGEGPGETFAAILGEDPASLCSKRPDVPEAYAAVVRRCMQREREQRFADVGELAKAIAPFGSGRWSALVESVVQTLARAGSDEPSSGARLRRPTPLGAIVPQPHLAPAPSPPEAGDNPAPESPAPPAPTAQPAVARSGTEHAVTLSSRHSPTVLSIVREEELKVRRQRRRRGLVAGLVVAGALAAAFPFARPRLPFLRAHVARTAVTAAAPPVAAAEEPSSAALAPAPARPPLPSSAEVAPPTASIPAVAPAASATGAPLGHAKPGRTPRGISHSRPAGAPPAAPAPAGPKTFEPQDL
jgi:eukaryotic-like serine/threonine-protein kinase